MILTQDEKMAEELSYLRSLAFGKVRFYHEVPGYNFRLTAMQAAMGVVQTARLEEVIRKKISLYRRYQIRLAGIREIQLVQEPPEGRHVHWMVGLRLGPKFGVSRDRLRDQLATKGIDTRTFFCPMNQQPFLRQQVGYRDVPCPVADALWQDGLYLPSTTSLTDADLDHIIGHIQAAA